MKQFQEITLEVKKHIPENIEQMAEDYVKRYWDIMDYGISVRKRHIFVADLKAAIKYHLPGRHIECIPSESLKNWWVEEINYVDGELNVSTDDTEYNTLNSYVPILSDDDLDKLKSVVDEVAADHDERLKSDYDSEANKQKEVRRQMYLALKKEFE